MWGNIMTPRQQAALISGVVAGIVAFLIWLVMDNDVGPSLVYGIVVGIVCGGVTWWQKGRRA
jgi:ABC-type thiamin/hydroxymethylpyrimidine transport system permease subunit